MTQQENKKNPYTLLASEEKKQAPTPKKQAKQPVESSTNIPVQDTRASVPDGQDWISIIIKVIIDIIARLTGQKSPTGGVLPTAHSNKVQLKQSQEKIRKNVTGGLETVGNGVEKLASSLLQKAKDSGSSTLYQAVDTAKNVGQSAVNIAKDSVGDVVNTAKDVALEAKNVAHTHNDTAPHTTSKKDPLI